MSFFKYPYKLFPKSSSSTNKTKESNTPFNGQRISVSSKKSNEFENNLTDRNSYSNTSSDINRNSNTNYNVERITENFNGQRISEISKNFNGQRISEISKNFNGQRISFNSNGNLNNFNENENGGRHALTLNSIKMENNLPILYKLHKSGVVGSNFGTVYIYKNPQIYNSTNTEKINNDDKILWEYYMLNNFLFTKELYDKKNKKNSINSAENLSYSDVYPLVIYPFKETIEEFNTELMLSENEEIKKTSLKLQSNKNLLETKKKEKNKIKSELKESNKTINTMEIQLKELKKANLAILTSYINTLEKNINNRNENLKYTKLMYYRDKKNINLSKSKILLEKKKYKNKNLKEKIEIRIEPEKEKLESRRLISELEKNINKLTIQRNKSEENLQEIDKIISTFNDIKLLNKKAKFIKKILEIVKLNATPNTKTLDNITKKLQEFKEKNNFYAKEEEILENNKKFITILFKKINTLTENNSNKFLKDFFNDTHEKLTKELELIEDEIKDKTSFINISKYNGGDPLSASILVILTFITTVYIHFSFIIKIFARYILTACSKEMKNLSRTNVIKKFIRTNFKDLFITYILVIALTALGPLGLILNHVILFGITKFILSKSLNKGIQKLNNVSKSEQKFHKTLNFLCNKGKNDKSIGTINRIKGAVIEQVNSKKFQIKCIAKSTGLISNSSINEENNEENNEKDLDLYRIILISKQNSIYRFNIINLLDDTIYGHIEASADIIEKIYLTENKVSTTITGEQENEIFNYVKKFTGHVNENYSNFINFLRDRYRPKSA